ncbi:glycosyltransferase [Homoserinimonas sp. OAct 916]|uniref:glycosyltransferase n=1 Tax=Homoserinimonas sp. OAct 916 TaxID=2211450 RepID=UPI000DBE0F4F|nr:glycosyltransferase [Homoserinimonas sp. OAct 916]
MESVLFVTWDGGGNVPPALGIGAELERRGNEVRFLGHPNQKNAIEEAGFSAEEFQRARPWSMLEVRSGLAASLAAAGVFTDRAMGEDLIESVKREHPDRVVIDGLLVGAMSAAARAGIPYSVLVHTLYGVMHKTLTRGPLALIARGKGINPARLYESADHILAVTLEELDHGTPADVDYTGPVLPQNARDGTQGPQVDIDAAPEPVILVSLSTTYIPGQREALQRILDALGGLPVHALITTGLGVEPADLRAPVNADVYRYVPHPPLMKQASLVIGHGGHATTMLALAHNLPLLIMPMNPAFDQPAIGRVIAEQNAGLTLGKKATVSQIRDAVTLLLPRSSSYRVAAARLGGRIRSTDGASLAADLITTDLPTPISATQKP